jgi:hypothetical protein
MLVKNHTDGLLENLQRKDLIFMEEMESYAKLRVMYGTAEIVATKVGKTAKTVYNYLKIHTAFHSIPEIEEILFENPKHTNSWPTITFTIGEKFSAIAKNIKDLGDPTSKKMNTREFKRIIKNFEEDENTGDYILKLHKKFNKEPKAKTTEAPNEAISSPVFFTDSDKALSLTIHIEKNSVPLSPEHHASILEAVDSFFSKLDVVTLAAVETNEA